MEPIASLPPLRDILRQHELTADKRLGQNFLLDLNLTDRIARSAGDLQDVTVIEIGPGPAGLTRSLLMNGAKKVIAIEQDARFYPVLEQLKAAAAGRFDYIPGDALKCDPAALATGKKKIVANLPYNIATVLLFQWLENVTAYESFTLMFQKEVAERIVAVPRTKDYGRLSVMAQWLCETRKVFDVFPKAFIPPPKVTSTIVSLIPRPQPLVAVERDKLDKVLRATFNQRRKMLRASLKELVADPISLLEQVGIDPMCRPEELSVEQFCNLAKMF